MLREGRKDEANVIQQLRDKQPSSAEVASAIGDYYLAARNPDAAIKEYQRGLSFTIPRARPSRSAYWKPCSAPAASRTPAAGRPSAQGGARATPRRA